MTFEEMLQAVFTFDNYSELLPLVQNSIWAGAVLGLLGGGIGLGDPELAVRTFRQGFEDG